MRVASPIEMVMNMKVERVSTLECIAMYTDEGTYYRYGAESWYVSMGESDETVYDCEHLETAFQEFKKIKL